MAYQEPQTVPQKLEELKGSDDSTTETTFGFSSLSLGTSITTGVSHKSPCAKCGFCPSGSNSGSLKRASPCSPSSSSVLHLHDHRHHHPPKPKKLFLDPLPDSNLASSKISFPPSSYPPTQTPNQSLLRRCVSDPYKSPVAAKIAGPTTLSPEHAVNIVSTPSQNNLRRCFSDPCKSPVSTTNNLATIQSPELAAQGSTSDKALPPPAQRQSISGATPHPVTNLRSFSGKMDNGGSECTNYVSVERSGESLVVHFNCNCGKGCQILVNGGSYYYKLA